MPSIFPPSRRTPQPQPGHPLPQAGSTATSLLRRYRPLETRATGGFGSVEICLDARLQRRVAIKRIPLAAHDSQTTAQITADALCEARTASMLQHPHIVSVIDFTYDAAYAYLVMEYVDGMSLEEFLANVEGNSLTYDEAACLADALVQALAYAHENGVLHLDIKPANVLIDRNGHIKLADFGMATLTSAAGFGGARGGTIGYMAPEQLRGEVVDERSDIFSLACVVYEALCGEAPFRADTPARSESLIERGVTAPSELLPDIPLSTERALLQALSPEADARMSSVIDYGDELLDGLGNPREGRKSFASIIARITSDEQDGPNDEQDEKAPPFPGWDVLPAEGVLGSHFPRARRALAATVCSAATAVASGVALYSAENISTVACIAGAVAVGAGSAIAPQLGPALVLAGFLFLICTHTPLLAVAPLAVLIFALVCAWWLVWGRSAPEASAAMVLACALVCIPNSEAILVAAPFAACTLSGSAAASSVLIGAVVGKLLSAACASHGLLAFGAALNQLLSAPFLIVLAAVGTLSVILGTMMGAAWKKQDASAGKTPVKSLYIAIYSLCALGTFAAAYLAHRMEIASVSPALLLCSAALALLSTILIRMYVYLFGYRKNLTKE